MYLTQFPIFFYNVGVLRNAEYYTPLLLVSILRFIFLSAGVPVASKTVFRTKAHKGIVGKRVGFQSEKSRRLPTNKTKKIVYLPLLLYL